MLGSTASVHFGVGFPTAWKVPRRSNGVCIFALEAFALLPSEYSKLAELAQNGLALAISPVHTMMDGDTMFVMANGQVECDFNLLSVAVTEVVRKAILSALEK